MEYGSPTVSRAIGTDLFRVFNKNGGKSRGGGRICENNRKEKIYFVLNGRIKLLWTREIFRLDCRFDNFNLKTIHK